MNLQPNPTARRRVTAASDATITATAPEVLFVPAARAVAGVPRGRSEMNSDVVVIGAGVIGSSIALELARSGREVVVVDKARGVGHGSTSASSAVVRFTFSTAAGVATAWESKQHWVAWQEHLGAVVPTDLARYVQCGLAMLDVDFAPRSSYVPLLAAAGVPYEEWDADTLAQRIPGIDVGRYWPPKRIHDEAFWADASGTLGAVYTPDGGYVSDPQLAAQNLADAAAVHGARFLLGETVVGIERDDSRVRGVQLAGDAKISCPMVVNAAGPWSGKINELAGVGNDFAIGVRPMRQEVHQVAAPGSLDVGGQGIAFADMDLGTYIRAESGGNLLIGGTEPECDPLQWLDDPDDCNPNPTLAVFDAQVTRAARRLPDLTVPNRATGIAGVYDVADDWTPIYDQTDLGGFFVAIGTSGNQFKNAPVVGQFMRAIIDQVDTGISHDDQPVQFLAAHTGAKIDLSTFSRRRSLNSGSSGTVMG
jgi:sarcosine oxidase subunit beta